MSDAAEPAKVTGIGKKSSLLVAAFSGLVVFGALAVLTSGFAKGFNEAINESFSSATAAQNFESLSGTWLASSGTYSLSEPAQRSGDNGVANASINRQAIPSGEWRLATTARILATSDVHDLSVIFDYVDESNYLYANFSDKTSGNGVYRVANGEQSALVGFPTSIVGNRDYVIEIRRDGDRIKVFRDQEYIAGTRSVMPRTSTRVGYGSRGGAAVFDNLVVQVAGMGSLPAPAAEQAHPKPANIPHPEPASVPSLTPEGGRQVSVSNSSQLVAAITDVRPGDVITLADGSYGAKMLSPMKVGGSKIYAGFVATTSGTAAKPIVVQGTRKAIVNGDGLGGHYGIHLHNVSYWQLKGFSVGEAKKGIVLDGANNNLIDGVEVYNIHDEGIHLRSHSSDNIVRNSYIHHTGLTTKGVTNGYGEGLYVGSASSNWRVYTSGAVDASNRNQLIGNTVAFTAGEGIDIKEGTVDGVIKDNTFESAGIGGSNFADSWIDIKGNNWTITGNRGTTAKKDGLQVHGNQLKTYGEWGNNNVFAANHADVQSDGYGFWLQNNVSGNTVSCNNTVVNAGSGFGNVVCKN